MSFEVDNVHDVNHDLDQWVPGLKCPEDYIDPIVFCATVALFRLMEDGSRISIGRKVKIERSVDYKVMGVSYLGAVRRIHGESRKELDKFKAHAQKAMKWFPVEQEADSVTRAFFTNVAKGLGKISETYKEAVFYEETFGKWQQQILDNSLGEPKRSDSPQLDEKVQGFWKLEYLQIINQNLELADKDAEDKDLAISIIESVIRHNDKKLDQLRN
ncbi:MAG: hypothetical protein WD595_00125 [Waddliaceae bacterium]